MNKFDSLDFEYKNTNKIVQNCNDINRYGHRNRKLTKPKKLVKHKPFSDRLNVSNNLMGDLSFQENHEIFKPVIRDICSKFRQDENFDWDWGTYLSKTQSKHVPENFFSNVL